MPVTTRFAPSPTGWLHLGHAYAALNAHRRARDAHGRFLLRLEDIDATRCRPEYAAAIAEDLAWLGIDWDGPVRVQSHHGPDYAAVLDALQAQGVLYPCFCSRSDVARSSTAPHGPDGVVYAGTCRSLDRSEAADRIAAGQPHAYRIDVVAALRRTGTLSFAEEGQGRLPCDPAAFGDTVLGRPGSPTSYHLCATHDDAVQGVTLVTRSRDLLAATSIHRLLQTLMGWPEPGYAHHRLLTDAQGRRLAKRDGAVGLRALRLAGCDPATIRAQAG